MNWIKRNWSRLWPIAALACFVLVWFWLLTAHAQKPEPRVNITTVWELTPENYRDIEQHCVAVLSPAHDVDHRHDTEVHPYFDPPMPTGVEHVAAVTLKLRCEGR